MRKTVMLCLSVLVGLWALAACANGTNDAGVDTPSAAPADCNIIVQYAEPGTFDSRVADASAIVVGKVVRKIAGGVDSANDTPTTTWEIDVVAPPLKGSLSGLQQIKQYGGDKDGELCTVNNEPIPNVGDQALFILKPSTKAGLITVFPGSSVHPLQAEDVEAFRRGGALTGVLAHVASSLAAATGSAQPTP